MKKIKVEDALGSILAHDMTKIVPGEFKGVAFKKGHIIKKEDIEILKDMGKRHVFILELTEDELHEDDAAFRIASCTMGEGIRLSKAREGKISLIAEYDGILQINIEKLYEINYVEGAMLSTLHNNYPVKKDMVVAGTRIIPLTIETSVIESIEEITKNIASVVSIKKIQDKKIGIIVTGSEVFTGRITDKFGPILEAKIDTYGGIHVETVYSDDEVSMIEEKMQHLIDKGADIILLSGGMSVDPDDVTPTAIRKFADNVTTYGSPVLPGAMFMLAKKGNVDLLGIPGCGMYHKIT
ncbi:MAG: molybdopterin-binding protein, partial [Acidaminobacteraceae bacterium]